MSFDAWMVSFGLSRVLLGMRLVAPRSADWVVLAVVFIDLVLLSRFFAQRGLSLPRGVALVPKELAH
jgi:hypothetical protein